MPTKALRPLAILLGLLLAGCATPYGAFGFTGGYRDEKVDDTHYRVRFDGNGHASKERIWNFWFYRCAELTKEKGFVYFILEEPAAKKESLELAEARQPEPAPALEPAGGGSRGATGGPRYIYVPGQTITSTSWHSNAVIEMCGEIVPAKQLLFKAQDVMDLLGPYVRSNGEGQAPERLTIFNNAAYVLGPNFKVIKVSELKKP